MNGQMGSTKKPKARRNAVGQQIQPAWPLWYFPDAPLGSAVKYLASLSPKFNWVGIYTLSGNTLNLGPYLGGPAQHQRIAVGKGKGFCGLAVDENKNQNISNVADHPDYLPCSQGTRSELVVLVHNRQGEILGQIDIDSHTENAFGPDEQKAVQQIAKELGELWPG